MDKQFSLIVETMKKMYKEKKITITQVKNSYNNGVITIEEYDYILGKKGV